MPLAFDDLLQRELQQLSARGLLRRLDAPLPPGVTNYSSNDYLGLSTHPALFAAAQRAHQRATGAGAARLVGGDLAEHHALEATIASFKGCEAALLFSSGYQANVGTIAALVGPHDAVFSDALNHASIVDGCRLSGAAIHVYRHGDTAHLATLLAAATTFRRRLIVTDSIFSMDGDAADLPEVSSLARAHDATLFVDEAHATGLYGPAGAGLLPQLGLKADAQLLTFGKALGSFGAAVTGSHALIAFLLNRARTFVFTTALPPSLCATTQAAFHLVASAEGDRLRARLFANARRLHTGLVELGLRRKEQPASPILPLHAGPPASALAAAAALLARGCFVQAIRPPTVPEGTSRLRLTACANHSADQLDTLLRALAELVCAGLLPTVAAA
ncbi:MAG: 8-amino-7-oxononanoate synthase [Proteobacteria bacterium]|nr:8-amino-7-oxononanoate synthase [Pseudomonadota bacterium]